MGHKRICGMYLKAVVEKTEFARACLLQLLTY
jgi:hypothetical protein